MLLCLLIIVQVLGWTNLRLNLWRKLELSKRGNKMNKSQKVWLLFAGVIYLGLVIFTVEYVRKCFSIVGLILIFAGAIGWLINELHIEMKDAEKV